MLITKLGDLPNLRNGKKVYLDFETTSGDRSIASFDPHGSHCDIAGVGIAVDASPAYYIPVGHRMPYAEYNLPRTAVYKWLYDIMQDADEIVGHNVKYDAHVWVNKTPYDLAGCKLVDTMVGIKILDSDQFTYSLTACAKRYLNRDVKHLAEAFAAYLDGNKDYGLVPVELMAPYCIQDINDCRDLHYHTMTNMPEQCMGVFGTETDLTQVLFKMEQKGMRVDLVRLLKLATRIMQELRVLQDTLDDVSGEEKGFKSTNKCCENLLCGKFGLPVLEYTENNNPSFSKHALTQYRQHPDVRGDDNLDLLLQTVMKYRQLETFVSLYIGPWTGKLMDGLSIKTEWLHPDYNQIIRTGRMSCRNPNAQQLNALAKSMIIPDDDDSMFVAMDQSQIEFRTMMHYCGNKRALNAYQTDPATDYHQWVADECQIPRRPAKNVNFMLGFGGGKRKTVNMLTGQMELMDNYERDATGEAFDVYCRRRANEVYQNYHAALPEIKTTSKRAQFTCLRRGYVFNLAGRRRHLPQKAAHKAFNTLNQSSAADIMKERLVAVQPVLDEMGGRLVSVVHDEALFCMPRDTPPAAVARLQEAMEENVFGLRVPIYIGCGVTTENWSVASKADDWQRLRPERLRGMRGWDALPAKPQDAKDAA